MFPQNMYVLNRYANYPNGNQEAWPLQLAGLFLFHFSCNTSRSLVMETQCIVAVRCCPFCSCKLNASFASNWSDTTTGWCYQQRIHSRGIKLQHGLFANASFFCVSPTCWCWCNWNQHHVNETPAGLCLSRSGHSLVSLYVMHQSFCCVWLCACMYTVCVRFNIQTWMHRYTNKYIYGFYSHLFISSQI